MLLTGHCTKDLYYLLHFGFLVNQYYGYYLYYEYYRGHGTVNVGHNSRIVLFVLLNTVENLVILFRGRDWNFP